MSNDTLDSSLSVLRRLSFVAVAALGLIAGACSSDDPAASTTTGEPSGTSGVDSERFAYGIDLSELELPAADPYEDYETVRDDTGQVEVDFPSDWDDVDTRAADRDGEAIPGVWASTDLDALQSGFSVPGAQADLRSAASESELLDLLNADNSTSDVCTGPETFDYDDGLYTGTAELWTECTDAGASLLQLAAVTDDGQYVTLEVQMLTDADIDAAIQALVSLRVTENSSATGADDTEPPTTADKDKKAR